MNEEDSEKHVLRAVQKPGELMLIPSGWWHMAYNPVETLAFSSQFLNLQNCKCKDITESGI